MQKEGNAHEHWFSRCASLGWTRAGISQKSDSVTSPKGVVITWDGERGMFRWDESESSDFRRLVDAIVRKLDEELHASRRRIKAIRQTTKELREVIGTAREAKLVPPADWTVNPNGSMRLSYEIGPLTVEAAVSMDGRRWSVSMEDGQVHNAADGTAEDAEESKLKVAEKVMEWCDELCETGRYAVKVFTRLKNLTE